MKRKYIGNRTAVEREYKKTRQMIARLQDWRAQQELYRQLEIAYANELKHCART